MLKYLGRNRSNLLRFFPVPVDDFRETSPGFAANVDSRESEVSRWTELCFERFGGI